MSADNRRRLLIIAVEFPPVKGIGRMRPLKFCQHLPALGWETAVLTLEQGDMQPVDLKTLDEIPAGTRVFRARLPQPKKQAIAWIKSVVAGDTGNKATPPGDPSEHKTPTGPRNTGFSIKGLAGRMLGGWDAFARKNILIPDDLMLWTKPAMAAGLAAVRDFKPDIILATAPYFTDFIVGARLSRATGIPWIADYRDLWTGDVLREWVPPWRRKLELAMELRNLATASAIVTVSEPKTRVMQERLAPVSDACCLTLTNGYDPEEFEGIVPEVGEPGFFRIVYAGRLFKNRRGYELITAVGLLVAEHPDYRNRLRLEYFGGISPEIAERMDELLEEHNLRDVVKFFPDVPYDRSKSLQKGADALLLIVDGGETSSGVIPGKLFEYIAADRPILCLAAPGATTEIIERGRLGYSVRPDDVMGLKQAVRRLVDGGGTAFAPDREYIGEFERRKIVTRLASLLNSVCAPAPGGK